MKRGGFTLLEVLVTLAVLSIGAVAVMRFATQTQDSMAEAVHVETLSRLAQIKLVEVLKDDLSSGTSGSGDFEDAPGYAWEVGTRQLRDGGWHVLVLTVFRKDTGRSVSVERIFREVL